ncbi:MAG TPA: hypothetical protein VHX49_16040 [Candidatus Acidoferrales bacterium]|jgi:hypothetical protein|nr:hypothetical protein [Candidatus Acidoferrales bacterium]
MTIPIKTLISVARSIAILAALAAAMACATPAQQAPTQPAPAQRPLARDGFPIGPSAHIDSFTASPGAIQPGQSVTLAWSAVNADRVTLDPGVGIVATRDSMMVTPPATTTYTLRVMGFGGKLADARSVTVLVAGTTAAPIETAPAADDSLASKPVPRMPDGHPDLNGIYIAPYHSIRTVDEIKLKPGAEKYHVGPEYTFSLGEHCLPRGVPDTIGEPYPIQIIQNATEVAILYEAGEYYRVIPTDGRGHPKDIDPTWMGNSVGYWDGDTLVVDAIGFNDKVSVGEYRHTTAYHVVERFQRTAYDTLKYSATIDDPNVFAAPWTEVGTFTLHPEWYLQEYICDENNHDYQKLFEQYKP